MKKWNANSGMKILSDNIKNEILPLKKQTYQLQLKHPRGKEASPEILLPDKPEPIHLIKFKDIDQNQPIPLNSKVLT